MTPDDQKKIETCIEAAKKAVEYTRRTLYIGSDNNLRREVSEFVDTVSGLAESGLARAAGAMGLASAVGGAVGSSLASHAQRHKAVVETKNRHDAYGTPGHGMEWPLYIDYCAHVAEETHAGNCGEHAAVAFKHLMNFFEEAWPIDFMQFVGKDHNFVILNRSDEIPIENFEEWSKNAVVCDPWKGAWGMAGKLDDWYGWTSMVSRWRFPEGAP